MSLETALTLTTSRKSPLEGLRIVLPFENTTPKPVNAPPKPLNSPKSKKKEGNKQVNFTFAALAAAASELDSDSSKDSDDEFVTSGTFKNCVRDDVKRLAQQHGTLLSYVRSYEWKCLRNHHECNYLARRWTLMKSSEQKEFVARRFIGLLCANQSNHWNAMTTFFGTDGLILSQSLLSNLVKRSNAISKYQRKQKKYAALPKPSNKKHPRGRKNSGKRGQASEK